MLRWRLLTRCLGDEGDRALNGRRGLPRVNAPNPPAHAPSASRITEGGGLQSALRPGMRTTARS